MSITQSSMAELHSIHQGRLLQVVRESTQISRRLQLMLWLQGELQEWLPHHLLLVAYGNFATRQIRFQVVPSRSESKSRRCNQSRIPALIPALFERWVDQGCSAYCVSGTTPREDCSCALHRTLNSMHSVLVHGLRDERQGLDVLYILFKSDEAFDTRARRMLELLLPHIDFAMRRVTDMEDECDSDEEASASESERTGLSAREIEILKWVGNGKTNYEIGMILDISAFTVKNHLQRIFRKLDVTNRAQAIAKLEAINHAPAALSSRWAAQT